jgi:hypothetical protein
MQQNRRISIVVALSSTAALLVTGDAAARWTAPERVSVSSRGE